MYSHPLYFALELKSTKGTSFSFGTDKSMIKPHQVEGLTLANQYKGIVAGFLFNMRKYEQTYFLHIDAFNKFTEETTKSSINKNDILKYGGILIDSIKKRTRYKYDIEGFINGHKKKEKA